jgi:hypothetical protein
MNLDINIDMDAIRALALKTAREKAESAARAAIEKHFHNGSYWQQPKGVGYMAIEQQIDELICGDEIANQTRRIIDEKFAAILEREIEYQLTRRAKKLAAAEIKGRGL